MTTSDVGRANDQWAGHLENGQLPGNLLKAFLSAQNLGIYNFKKKLHFDTTFNNY